ncbi:hypothetical protein HPP92_024366 [Vanilla planifolia]|uniref:Bifunctional inhibitor/plant lipid transfer protein/seed storage helical domain-containing protein n=1 Tax=Vanilla planifolia TaxID=51239 RepID=A0A835PKQ6_VANPL|nr:hypothetical protein HPP92_024366 [Vanilla planifolia]
MTSSMNGLMTIMVFVLATMSTVHSDFANDQKECTDQLMILMPCLGFVQGEARVPTQDCCACGKTVVSKSFKCLCILIKDRNEPQLGLKLNISRVVTMPAACNIPANISECPKLLQLPQESPLAKDFFDLEKEITKDTEAAKATASGGGNATNSTSRSSSSYSRSSAGKGTEMWETAVVLQVSLLLLLELFKLR